MISRIIISNKAAIIGWFARGGVLLLSFLNTRLLIEVMGVDAMAAYTIILSITPWIGLLNLGLPITMQNEVSRLRSKGMDIEELQKYAFGTMIVVGILLLPAVVVIGWIVNSVLLINQKIFTYNAVVLVVLFIYISAISQLMTQLMYANNDNIWPNLYPFISTVWILSVLAVSVRQEINNINIILIVLMISNMIIPIHAGIRMKLIGKMKFNLKITLNHLALSKNMLIFSAIATTVLSVDYIIMSRMLNSVEIVKYNVANKLFMTFLVFHGVLIAVNWTPVSDSINSKKMKEAKDKIEEILKVGLSLGAAYGIIVIIYQEFIFENLTGGKIDNISNSLMISFLIYMLLRIWTDTYAVGLQGCGKVNLINIFLPIQALISCIGQYYLGSQYGAVGILWGIIFSFLLTASWIIPYHFYKLINIDLNYAK